MATKPPRSGVNAPLASAETKTYQTRSDAIGADRAEIGANRAPIGEQTTIRQLQALAKGAKQRERLSPALPQGAIPARKGIGEPGGTGGIASPLVEQDYLLREYYEDEREIKSSDGLFVFKYFPIKRVYMTDDNGEEVILEFAEPVDPSDGA